MHTAYQHQHQLYESTGAATRAARQTCSSTAVLLTLSFAQVPWEPRATSPKVGWLDAWFLSLFDRFARAALVQGQLRLILPTGEERCYGARSACTGHNHGLAWT